MRKLSTGWIIHMFALLHLGTAVLCRLVGLSDTLLLTLLTMTLTVLICLRERLSLEFTAVAIVLVNIVGYFAGVGLAALLRLFISGELLQSGLATFLTTELIGWGLWLAARSRFATRGKGMEVTFSDRQLMILVISIAIVYIVRVMLDIYSSGAGSRAEIVGNALALLIFVADVAFISRFVTRQVEAEREKGDEARQRYNVLKQHVDSLQDAVEQYRKTGDDQGLEKLLEKLPEVVGPTAAGGDPVAYKERHLVRVGDRIVPVQNSDIACFVSENKGTYLVCLDGTRYVINPSLEEVLESLDPALFFRISRSAIVSKKAVRGAERLPGGRLVLETIFGSGAGGGSGAAGSWSGTAGSGLAGAEMEVSRARVDAFLDWLEK